MAESTEAQKKAAVEAASALKSGVSEVRSVNDKDQVVPSNARAPAPRNEIGSEHVRVASAVESPGPDGIAQLDAAISANVTKLAEGIKSFNIKEDVTKPIAEAGDKIVDRLNAIGDKIAGFAHEHISGSELQSPTSGGAKQTGSQEVKR